MSGRFFHVANPSPYARSGFVEVDLCALGIENVDDASLRLYRVYASGYKEETTLQVDRIAGVEGAKRIMTFRCHDVPAGSDDYRGTSTKYCLEVGSSSRSNKPAQDLEQHFYHQLAQPGEPDDGHSTVWDRNRTVTGVSLRNPRLEVYFRLRRLRQDHPDISYTGSATSIYIPGAPENVLNYCEGFREHSPARWGQLTGLQFMPSPWDAHDWQWVPLQKMTYELAWAQVGPLRSVCSLRSEAFPLRYTGGPLFEQATAEVNCRLYRVFAVYADQHKPYYTEDLFVQTDNGATLAFRPHFYSCMEQVDCRHGLHRLEHIPDYFSIQQHFYPRHYLYGFAADAHVRNLVGESSSLRWRLSFGHHIKCTHLFMNSAQPHHDPLHVVGHDCWYEQLLKPMRVIDAAPCWPAW